MATNEHKPVNWRQIAFPDNPLVNPSFAAALPAAVVDIVAAEERRSWFAIARDVVVPLLGRTYRSLYVSKAANGRTARDAMPSAGTPAS